MDEALAAYREAIAEQPDHAPALFNLGQILRAAGLVGEASRCFEAAARLRPTATDAWINLGICQERLGDLSRAAAAYERAVQCGGRSCTAHFSLGSVRRRQGRPAEAIAAFREAERLEPGLPEVTLSVGSTLREMGEPAAGAAALRRALELRPGWAQAEWQLALALLSAGQLREGWERFETRWAQVGGRPDPGIGRPLWRGEPLDGRRILVWGDSGLADEILFVTCVPDLVERGGIVTLVADPRLASLLTRAFPDVKVVADRVWEGGDFDCHVPLGDLGRLLRSERGDFPARWSWLRPDRGVLPTWGERLEPLGPGLRVGLCWRSRLEASGRDGGPCPLEAQAPLFDVPGVTWIGLEAADPDPALDELERTRELRIHRWEGGDPTEDLEGAAALLWHLDVVISPPSVIGALAGALGIETWQLEPGNDWTGLGEPRSPWLPAIRMFRRAAGDDAWDGVIDEMAGALAERVRSSGRSERGRV